MKSRHLLICALLLTVALPAAAADFEKRVEQATARALPCVVQINVYGNLNDPDARFGGSGVLIDPDGSILTNHHVVANGRTIKVLLYGSDVEHDVEVLAEDRRIDLALIRLVDAHDLPYVEIGASEKLRPGQWILAMGNPMGMRSTVSAGVISFIDRADSDQIIPYVQIDAIIDKGSSGGGVFNLDGELVGIIKSGIGRGIGLAIPTDMIHSFIADVHDTGVSMRSWLGVQLQPLSPQLAAHIGLSEVTGVVVTDVVPDSPAQRAGMLPGDLMSRLGGVDLDGSGDLKMGTLIRQINTLPQGEELDCVIYRLYQDQYQPFGLKVTLVEKPSKPPRALDSGLGFVAEEPTTSNYREHYLDAPKGVIVSFVRSGSPAEQSDLSAHDVILAAEGKPIGDIDDLEAVLENIPADGSLLLEIFRGQRHYLILIRRGASAAATGAAEH
ncbi:MAG: trypsin-like peptidase domain-containing protein [Candidatus Alcyoniella australis]|nr:trypsin-like peptidase domain-containing protein [Candidatus Alcyoniella australis]